MKNQFILLVSLMGSIGAVSRADVGGLVFQNPKNIQFSMTLKDNPTDCTKINDLIQKISKLDCTSAKDAMLCGSIKNSLQFESKWGIDLQSVGGRFSKGYFLNLSTSFMPIADYSKRFDILYATSAEVSMPEQMQFTAKGKVSSMLVSLMEELKLDTVATIIKGSIPLLITKNKMMACGLESGDLFFETRSKLYVSYSHPLDAVKEKVLTRVYQKAMEVSDSNKKRHKKEFDLGVEVGKALSTLKELNLSATDLDEVATSIHHLILEDSDDGFLLRTQDRDVQHAIHDIVSPGYQLQELNVQFSVK